MTPNPYRGEVVLRYAGQSRIVRYSWSALVRLRSELGEDFDMAAMRAMASFDMPAVAKLLAIGLEEHWPNVTADDVMRESPPIAPVADAVRRALHYSFNGTLPAEVAAKPTENPLQRALKKARAITSRIACKLPFLPA